MLAGSFNTKKMKMKKSILLINTLLLCLLSCKNDEAVFPDFNYTTVYFPFQYPVRTLVLGDYTTDNSNDNNLRFLISTRIGGLYKNEKDRSVNYVLDPALAMNLKTSLDMPIEILPSKYYTLNPVNKFTIPKGQFTGEVTVQLTEDFLNDPLAFKTHYVIPLRLTTSNSADSVLSGKALISNPDSRIAGNWSAVPKDFTLFGVKFINPYHGKYLHRGKSIVKNGLGNILETIVYHQKYVELDEIWSLQTNGKNSVGVTGILRASAGSPGNYSMTLTFNDKGECVISKSASSLFEITGTGKFVKNADEWGNVKRNAIHLNYQVTQGTNIHNITDTLVIRDRDVRFEEFAPVVIK